MTTSCSRVALGQDVHDVSNIFLFCRFLLGNLPNAPSYRKSTWRPAQARLLLPRNANMANDLSKLVMLYLHLHYQSCRMPLLSDCLRYFAYFPVKCLTCDLNHIWQVVQAERSLEASAYSCWAYVLYSQSNLFLLIGRSLEQSFNFLSSIIRTSLTCWLLRFLTPLPRRNTSLGCHTFLQVSANFRLRHSADSQQRGRCQLHWSLQTPASFTSWILVVPASMGTPGPTILKSIRRLGRMCTTAKHE